MEKKILLNDLDPGTTIRVMDYFDRIPLIQGIKDSSIKEKLKIFFNEWDRTTHPRWKREYCRWMVTHSIEHIYGVFILANRFYEDNKDRVKFEDKELFFLILSIWLHDIGMYEDVYRPPSGEEMKQLNEFLDAHGVRKVDPETAKNELWVRDHHSLLAKYLIDKKSVLLEPLSSIIEDEERMIIENICLYHSSQTSLKGESVKEPRLAKLAAENFPTNDPDIDFLKLCALVRFLDGCDQTRRRCKYYTTDREYQKYEPELEEIQEHVGSFIKDDELFKQWKDISKITDKKIRDEIYENIYKQFENNKNIKEKINKFESILLSPTHFNYKEVISDIFFKDGKIIILPQDQVAYYESAIKRVKEGDIEKELKSCENLLPYTKEDILIEHTQVTGTRSRSKNELDYELLPIRIAETILKHVETQKQLAEISVTSPFIKKPLPFRQFNLIEQFKKWLNNRNYTSDEKHKLSEIDEFMNEAKTRILIISGKVGIGKRTLLLYYINSRFQTVLYNWNLVFISPESEHLKSVINELQKMQNVLILIDGLFRGGDTKGFVSECKFFLDFIRNKNDCKLIATVDLETYFYLDNLITSDPRVKIFNLVNEEVLLQRENKDPEIVYRGIIRHYNEKEILYLILILSGLGKSGYGLDEKGYGASEYFFNVFADFFFKKDNEKKGEIIIKIEIFQKLYCELKEVYGVKEYRLRSTWVRAIYKIESTFITCRVEHYSKLIQKMKELKDNLKNIIPAFVEFIKTKKAEIETNINAFPILADIAKLNNEGLTFCEDILKSMENQMNPSAVEYLNKTLNQIWFNKGEENIAKGNFSPAIDCYRKANEYKPYSRYLWKTGDCYAELGNLEKAIINYKKALQIEKAEKENINERIGKAYGNLFKKLRIMRGMREEWQKNLKILEEWDNYGKEAVQIGNDELKKGLFKNQQDYINFLKNYGDWEEAYKNRAKILKEKITFEKRSGEQLENLQRELGKNQNEDIKILQEALKKAGEFENTGKIDSNTRRGPNYFRDRLSRLYQELGQEEQAAKETIGAAEQERTSRGFLEAAKRLIYLKSFSNAQIVLGQWDNYFSQKSAEEEKLMRRYLQGIFLSEQDRKSEAKQVLEKLLIDFSNWYMKTPTSDEDRPGDILSYIDDLYFALGKCYEKEENFSKALEYFESYLLLHNLDPAVTRENMADTYSKIGDRILCWKVNLDKSGKSFREYKDFLEKARLFFSEAEKRLRWKFVYLRKRAHVNYLLGRLEQALEDIKNCIKIKRGKSLDVQKDNELLEEIENAIKHKYRLGKLLTSILDIATEFYDGKIDLKKTSNIWKKLYYKTIPENEEILKIWLGDIFERDIQNIDNEIAEISKSINDIKKMIPTQKNIYKFINLTHIYDERIKEMYDTEGKIKSPIAVFYQLMFVVIKTIILKTAPERTDSKEVSKYWSKFGKLIDNSNRIFRFKIPYYFGIKCLEFSLGKDLNPRNFHSFYNLGWQLIYLGKYEDAKKKFEEIRKSGLGYREFPKSWAGLAKIYENYKDFDSAADCYVACTNSILETEEEIAERASHTIEVLKAYQSLVSEEDKNKKMEDAFKVWGDIDKSKSVKKINEVRDEVVGWLRKIQKGEIRLEIIIKKLDDIKTDALKLIRKSLQEGSKNLENLCFLINEDEIIKRKEFLTKAKDFYERALEYVPEDESLVQRERINLLNKQIRRLEAKYKDESIMEVS